MCDTYSISDFVPKSWGRGNCKTRSIKKQHLLTCSTLQSSWGPKMVDIQPSWRGSTLSVLERSVTVYRGSLFLVRLTLGDEIYCKYIVTWLYTTFRWYFFTDKNSNSKKKLSRFSLKERDIYNITYWKSYFLYCLIRTSTKNLESDFFLRVAKFDVKLWTKIFGTSIFFCTLRFACFMLKKWFSTTF